jgi:transcriptional regulator with XRE-family HTH domain
VSKNNLKRILNAEGQSQTTLARISGVSGSTLNRVFNEKRTPSPKTLAKIVSGLNKILVSSGSKNKYELIDVFPNAKITRRSLAENNLKEILDSEGKSQVELANAAGISDGTLNKIFNGKITPSIKILNKILTGLNKISEKKQYKFSEVFPSNGDEDDEDDDGK